MMSDDDKLMFMFTHVHGEMSKSCYTEFHYDELDSSIVLGVNVMKGGNLCWYKSKTDIMFDWLTNEWGTKA